MAANQDLFTVTARGIRPRRGRVLIAVEREYEDEVKVGDVSLVVDVTYKPLDHIQTFGTVVAAPIDMPEWHVGACEVQPGDRVRFLYLSICDANLVVLDGQRYWLVPYEQVYYIERPDGTVSLLNDYCLVPTWMSPKSGAPWPTGAPCATPGPTTGRPAPRWRFTTTPTWRWRWRAKRSTSWIITGICCSPCRILSFIPCPLFPQWLDAPNLVLSLTMPA
jgi:hypothetical protein